MGGRRRIGRGENWEGGGRTAWGRDPHWVGGGRTGKEGATLGGLGAELGGRRRIGRGENWEVGGRTGGGGGVSSGRGIIGRYAPHPRGPQIRAHCGRDYGVMSCSQK